MKSLRVDFSVKIAIIMANVNFSKFLCSKGENYFFAMYKKLKIVSIESNHLYIRK